MAHTQAELEDIRECVKELIDEKYFPTLHEIRKKLAISDAKLQEAMFQLTQKELALKKYEECHKCHQLMVEHADVSTQVTPEDYVSQTNGVKPQQQQQQQQQHTGADDSSHDTPSDLNISDEDLEQNGPNDVTMTQDVPKAAQTNDKSESLPVETKEERVSPSGQDNANCRMSEGFVTPSEEPEVIYIDSD